LNIRTRRPNFEETEFFANATAGNFDQTNIQLGVSGPINDQLAYRLSGAVRNQDGFLESTTGAESRDRDRYLLRGQLQWNPTDNLDIRFIGDYSEADEQCCDAVVLLESGAVGANAYANVGLPANGGVQALGDSAFRGLDSNAEQFENPNDQWGASVEVNWDINDAMTLTYIGAYREFDAQSVQHSDFVSLDIFSVQPSAAGGLRTFDAIETVTHEIRLAGETDWVSWMVGGYYSDEQITENQGLGLGADYSANVDAQLFFFALAPALGPAAGLSGVPLATGGTFGDVLAAASPSIAFGGGVNAAGSFAQNIFDQDGESWSIFTHNTFHLTPQLDLVVGLRWTDEEKDGSFRQPFATNDNCLNTIANGAALNAGAAGTGLEGVAGNISGLTAAFACFPFAAPADTGIPILPETFDDTFSDEELVYTGKLVYAFTDTISGYLSFTHGFKAGGFNLDATAAAGGGDPRFDSELIDSWELGLKTELFDRRLRANFSLFDYDIEDFQVLEFTGVRFETFNVPNARSQGAELELLAVPTEGLQLNLGVTYAESEYPTNCDGNAPDAPVNVSSLCGAQFTNAPDTVVTYGASYDGLVGDRLAWFANVNARWEDERRTSTQPGLPLDFQGANTKVNARLGIGSVDGTWAVELWGNNITDEQTKNVTFNTPLRIGSRSSFLEAPRTYGVTLRTQL
ncbi:MAG: TonB-dependent receptor, partial [Pseudomonadota bacterium]